MKLARELAPDEKTPDGKNSNDENPPKHSDIRNIRARKSSFFIALEHARNSTQKEYLREYRNGGMILQNHPTYNALSEQNKKIIKDHILNFITQEVSPPDFLVDMLIRELCHEATTCEFHPIPEQNCMLNDSLIDQHMKQYEKHVLQLSEFHKNCRQIVCRYQLLHILV